MASKYVRDTAAAKSLAAYVILNKKGEEVATVQAHYSNGGTCLVNVWDHKTDLQHDKAGGYGYDKFVSALDGMTIDGHVMTNHCSRLGAPKPPKGRKTFPRDYKPKKGYTLANYTSFSKETGNSMHRYDWIEKAIATLGIDEKDSETKNSRWEEIQEKAYELEIAWQQSDDCETGYSDCYRESGLDYLKALGYKVIQAI